MMSKGSKLEYSCSDGSCIPIGWKCNYVPDCWDGGEEENCTILHLENMGGYKQESPDIDFDDARDIIKKHVMISTNITRIESIDEVKSRFTASFVLLVEWIIVMLCYVYFLQ